MDMTTALMILAGVGGFAAWTLVIIKLVAHSERTPFRVVLRLSWLPVGLVLAITVLASSLPLGAQLLAERRDGERRAAALTAFVDQYRDSGREISLEGFDQVDTWIYQFTNAGGSYLAIKLPAGWLETELVVEGAGGLE